MYRLGAVCEDAPLLRRSELVSESILLSWLGWALTFVRETVCGVGFSDCV
ncbi:hypothetical protein PCIT_b0399 [Pseudoalteromonas citrea]|uniref:Uncharacterized protein n=1 Tax=Pseudoalteromonas citrea TaxID=43655 RepID=A0AAD4AEC9_9GAMM|nr:hypothetical protein PCIT_b0399 [Pseudoalteromonas citrea]